MKKFLIGLLVVIVLGVGGYFLYSRYQKAGQAQAVTASFETAALQKGELTSTISAIGKVRARQSASLSWDISGTVEKVNIEVGQLVKSGNVLANLAQTSLPQSVITAQADLASAQQNLDDLYTNAETAKVKAMQDIVTYEQAVRDAQYQIDNFTIPTDQASMSAVAAVETTKKTLDEARLAFEPYKFRASSDPTRKDLLETLNNAQSAYDSAIKRLKYEYALEVAQTNLDKTYQDYKKWENGPDPVDVEAAKARIAATQATLNQAWIEAPFNGTVTQVKPLVGDQVSPSTLAFRLDDLSTLYVDLEVSEIDIEQVQKGQQVSITFDAIRNQEYHGRVNEVALVSSQSSGVVNYTVTVELSDPDEKVRPGMTSEVEIMVAQRENVLLIPNQSIRLEEGKQVVYLMKNNLPVPVPVTVGLTSDTYSELVQGELAEGDQVLLNPADAEGNDGTRRFMMMGGGGGGGGSQPPDDGGQPEGGPGGQP